MVLTFWACACAAPTALVSKTDAVAMYPASQSNFTVSPPLKYKIITYTVSGVNSVATLTCAPLLPPCVCLYGCCVAGWGSGPSTVPQGHDYACVCVAPAWLAVLQT